MALSKEEIKFREENQWIDPNMLLISQGNKEWAEWATRWLYENVIPLHKLSNLDSYEWSRYGYIDQFDRTLHFDLPNATMVEDGWQTNNRNWLMISRQAIALNSNDNSAMSLSLFDVALTVPPTTFVTEQQPASLVFGSGEWPNYRFFPERWFANVQRNFQLTNNSGVAATFDIGLLFLQVRTN